MGGSANEVFDLEMNRGREREKEGERRRLETHLSDGVDGEGQSVLSVLLDLSIDVLVLELKSEDEGKKRKGVSFDFKKDDASNDEERTRAGERDSRCSTDQHRSPCRAGSCSRRWW